MASIIKADNIQKVSDGTNIIKKCGSTITLGSCGATIALACGASQTGFGRTGTVDWCTTAKTAPFTGVSGKGYFVNTTSGAVTVSLPATPTAGDIISVADYASTFQLNALTICNNGSLFNGECNSATVNTKGQSLTFIYVDGTRGWKNTMDSTSNVGGAPNYIQATGGTETTCGNYKIHTFTSDGTFCVSGTALCAADNKVDYLVIAGGGSGGPDEQSGGGGAGGYRESHTVPISGCYTASPLASACGALTVSAIGYPITIGAGGTANYPNCAANTSGSNSVFSSITSAGGGKGGRGCSNTGGPHAADSGGSGGGGGTVSGGQAGGAGNTPPTSPSQGNPGGTSGPNADAGPYGGGGGGAGAAGTSGCNQTAPGGIGVGTAIAPTQGTPGPTPGIKYFAGGGGGGGYSTPGIRASGGAGGGGAGGASAGGAPYKGGAGTANTGGGGGGAYSGGPLVGCYGAGAGGSGIVVIRYRYQ
jgi:hypothetical protein